MKKFYVLLFTFLSFGSFAQTIEFTGLGGYSVNGNLRTWYGNYPIDNSSNFGGIVSLEAARGSFVEFLYSRNDTKFDYRSNSIGPVPIDMAIEHYQLGSLQQFNVHEIIKPFAALSIGLSRFHPKENLDQGGDNYKQIYDIWAFTPILGAGVKVLLTDFLAIRLQSRFILPLHFNVGSGYTAGNGGFIGIPSVSGDFTAGLVLRIGRSD